MGPTLSFRGIDNASYYWLKPDNPRYYDDFTGCGSSVNLSHPRVMQMVMDSLRYWVEVCHIDGFRFDLATTLARGPNGFDRNASFLTAIRQDPVMATVKLVAEPWDLGLGGYQVGAFPSQWSEWNDRYRSAMRRYWSGEGSLIGEVSRRMTALPTCSTTTAARRAPASIISPSMTVSRSPTCSATTRSTTRPMARAIATAPTTTTATIAAIEGPTDDPADHSLAPPASQKPAGVPAARAGHAADPGRRRGRQLAERQQQRLLPGQRDRLGRLGQPRPGRRRPHRFHRPDDGVAKTLCAASLAALARRTARGRLVRRVVADAGGRGDEEEDWNFPEGRFLAYVLGPWNKGSRRSSSS